MLREVSVLGREKLFNMLWSAEKDTWHTHYEHSNLVRHLAIDSHIFRNRLKDHGVRVLYRVGNHTVKVIEPGNFA